MLPLLVFLNNTENLKRGRKMFKILADFIKKVYRIVLRFWCYGLKCHALITLAYAEKTNLKWSRWGKINHFHLDIK